MGLVAYSWDLTYLCCYCAHGCVLAGPIFEYWKVAFQGFGSDLRVLLNSEGSSCKFHHKLCSAALLDCDLGYHVITLTYFVLSSLCACKSLSCFKGLDGLIS